MSLKDPNSQDPTPQQSEKEDKNKINENGLGWHTMSKRLTTDIAALPDVPYVGRLFKGAAGVTLIGLNVASAVGDTAVSLLKKGFSGGWEGTKQDFKAHLGKYAEQMAVIKHSLILGRDASPSSPSKPAPLQGVEGKEKIELEAQAKQKHKM